MSALAGIIRFDGQDASARDLERMLATLHAHGPDLSGSLVDGPAALGHVLMRMTPEDSFERQPLRSSGGMILVADARIDNRKELADALGIDPQRAVTLPDSAFILAAWEKWGNRTWARLRGPFAVAVWNPAERTLVLARDPLGLRALCFFQARDFLAFATMPKGLFALGDVPRELNREKFADFLILNHMDCETTVFSGIRRLHPGHFAVVGFGRPLAAQRFWSEENIPEIRLGSDQDYADALRERLDVAVRRALRTTQKVGSFLSGGLDSSSVAALAARALKERGLRLPAYSQVPIETFKRPPALTAYYDETPYVEAIKAMIDNIDVTYVRSGEEDDFADLDRIFAAVDGPVRNVTNLGWMMRIYRLAQSDNQRVLLTGDGGNLTVSWDGWEQSVDHLLGGHVWTAFRQWNLFYKTSQRSRLGALRELFLDPLGIDPFRLAASLRGKRKEMWRSYSAINPEFAKTMNVEQRAAREGYDFLQRRSRGALKIRIEILSGGDFRGEWEAGILALFGIDIRDPTSDLDVVQFCLGIPPQQFLAEGISRSLIRRAMWGALPAKLLRNHRRGQQASDWFQNLSGRQEALKAAVTELGSVEEVSGMIDIPRLQAILANWPTAVGNQQDVRDIQLALPRAMGAGRFVNAFRRRN